MKYFVNAVLFILSANLYAANEEYNGWEVGSVMSRGVLISYANTTNDSGSTLGVLCLSTSKACIPYLINGLTCTQEHNNYHALVSVDNRIKPVRMECFHINDQQLLLLPEKHVELMLKNDTYAVSFGTAGGKFRATYFGLEGMGKAVSAAREVLTGSRYKMKKQSDKNRYQDENL